MEFKPVLEEIIYTIFPYSSVKVEHNPSKISFEITVSMHYRGEELIERTTVSEFILYDNGVFVGQMVIQSIAKSIVKDITDKILYHSK